MKAGLPVGTPLLILPRWYSPGSFIKFYQSLRGGACILTVQSQVSLPGDTSCCLPGGRPQLWLHLFYLFNPPTAWCIKTWIQSVPPPPPPRAQSLLWGQKRRAPHPHRAARYEWLVGSCIQSVVGGLQPVFGWGVNERACAHFQASLLTHFDPKAIKTNQQQQTEWCWEVGLLWSRPPDLVLGPGLESERVDAELHW